MALEGPPRVTGNAFWRDGPASMASIRFATTLRRYAMEMCLVGPRRSLIGCGGKLACTRYGP